MTDFTATTPEHAAPGDALVAELLWVHNAIRHDLDVVTTLSEAINDGMTPANLMDELGRLQTNSPIWRLRVNCLHYCRFVHSHHHAEDIMLFPALRAANPALGPVVDRLEADHRLVSGYLDEIEDAARAIGREDTPAARQRIVDALHALTGHLLDHLAFEEQAVSPELRQWDSWPFAHSTAAFDRLRARTGGQNGSSNGDPATN